MNRRFLISFLLLASLGVQASLPCCLVGAVTESNCSGEDQLSILLHCRCCVGGSAPTSDSPLPVDESQEPTCPFCTGTADVKLNSSAKKDLQDTQYLSIYSMPVGMSETMVMLSDVPRQVGAGSLTARYDVVNCLLL